MDGDREDEDADISQDVDEPEEDEAVTDEEVDDLRQRGML